MSIYTQFKTDTKKEMEGVWKDLYENDDGSVARVLLKRAGGSNIPFSAELTKMMNKNRLILNIKKPNPAEQKEQNRISNVIQATCYGKHAILGWEGILDNDGKEIEFSTDKAIELMTALPDLTTIIAMASTDIANYREQDREEDLGN